MVKSCLVRRKEIQFRWSKWLSKVLECKNFPEENYSTRHSGWESRDLGGPSHLQENLNYNLSGVNKKMLNDLSLTQEGHRLHGEEWIFQQDTDALWVAALTKKYLLEQKIRLLDQPTYAPDLNPIENLWVLIVVKSLWRRATVLSNFWTQKCNFKCKGKNAFSSTSETSW